MPDINTQHQEESLGTRIAEDFKVLFAGLSETNAGHCCQGEPVRVGDVVYNLPESRYHGRRDDGAYVPLFIDSRIDPSEGKRIQAAMNKEAESLRAQGFTVV